MTTPESRDDIVPASYAKTSLACTTYNAQLQYLDSSLQRYAFPIAGGGVFLVFGVSLDQGLVISFLLFCCGAALSILATWYVPYPHSPEYILHTPTWTATRAYLIHAKQIPLAPMRDREGPFWKTLQEKRSHLWDKVRPNTAANDLAVHAIAKLLELSIEDVINE